MPLSNQSGSAFLPPIFARPAFRYGVCILATVIAGVLLFEALGMPLFTFIGMPHEFCYLRDPRLVWLHVVTDSLIGIAYLSISLTLAYLVHKSSKDIPFNWILLAFGLFIIACGFTHFMEVWVVWQPVYWLSGYVKVVTAAASVATALVLFPLVPRILRLVDDARDGQRRRIEVEQLNQELERFNYSVAHDLRSPLRGLSAFTQILLDDHAAELSPAARDYIVRMRTSVGKMDALITDLLKYATVGRQEIRLEDVALDDVLRATLALMDGEVAARRAEIVCAAPLPRVRGDALLLQVVFQNLLGNGMKFVAPGVLPRIEISASVRNELVTLSFADNGVGIPAAARDRVFGLFERLHSDQPGTGIGLALVQRAVERLQGRIGVDSASGTGSRFWVELALAPPLPEPAKPPRSAAS